MNASEIRFRLKPLMLPVAMLLGVLFHNYMGYVAFISPYLIFMMLLVTYCKINPGSFVVNRFVWSLLSVQVLGAAAVYVLILPAGAELAQGGVYLCILSHGNCRTCCYRNAWRISRIVGFLFYCE